DYGTRAKANSSDVELALALVQRGEVMKSAVGIILCSLVLLAQSDVQPTNSLPNPYQTIRDWAKMPEGRMRGSTSAAEIDNAGKSVWVAERCGQNSCLDRATNQMSPFP